MRAISMSALVSHRAFWRHSCRHDLLRLLRGTNVPRKILPFRRLLDGVSSSRLFTCGVGSILLRPIVSYSVLLCPIPTYFIKNLPFFLHISNIYSTFAASFRKN